MRPRDIKVLILGVDGYIGRALSIYLKSKGYEVEGVDDFSRRAFVEKIGSASLFPLPDASEIQFTSVDVFSEIDHVIKYYKPDVIVHLAEQPSAPYSMIDAQACVDTQIRNLSSTLNVLWSMREHCPNTHLIKLGTMGEYGDWIYERIDIPESSRMELLHVDDNDWTSGIPDNWISVDIPTPKWAGSFYHWSKVFDSYNIEFACKLWDLRATDINQGPVYGTRTRDMKGNPETRFDYDSYFGTVVNRFVVQSVLGIPLTVYGKGGQTRGYINLNDSVKAIELIIQNPPKNGELNVVNQLTEVLSVHDIAIIVGTLTGCEVGVVTNPRVEREFHVYNPIHTKLKKMGLVRPRKMVDVIPEMVRDVEKYKENIIEDVILPKTNWRK
jgi:nucleoside-diphosphate-sugar epimerase